MMRMWSEEGNGLLPNKCCSPEAVADARGVCQRLKIPFYLMNVEDEFKARVVDFFVDGYASGITPNPCLQCNRHVKFGTLLTKARALGAERLATGHYARITQNAEGAYELRKGIDPNKDQSYALHILTQSQSGTFPVSARRFHQTRNTQMARRFGLAFRTRTILRTSVSLPTVTIATLCAAHVPMRSYPVLFSIPMVISSACTRACPITPLDSVRACASRRRSIICHRARPGP